MSDPEDKYSASLEDQAAPLTQPGTLKESVRHALTNYFHEIDGEEVSDLYNLVLAEVEAPLLDVVMRVTRSNQSKAAQILGLNRGTLRKKLKQYNLL